MNKVQHDAFLAWCAEGLKAGKMVDMLYGRNHQAGLLTFHSSEDML